MTTDRQVAIIDEGERRLAMREDAIAARRELIKRQLAPGASDLELEYFLETARELGLSPLSREIYAVMRNTRTQIDGRWENVAKMVIQVGIDGYRAIGSRTGRFGGMRGPYWCGPDGEWKDVWLSEDPPAAAKVEIVLSDTRETVTGIATWREFAQKTPARTAGKDAKTGRTWEARPEGLSEMWEKMPSHMIAKCAEANAWRKALSGQTLHVLQAHQVQFNAEDAPAPDEIAVQRPASLILGAASQPAITLHMRDGESIESFRDRVRETKALRDALIDESMPVDDSGLQASELLYKDPDVAPATSASAPQSRQAEAQASEAVIDGVSTPGRTEDGQPEMDGPDDMPACAFCDTGEVGIAFEEEDGEAKPICQPCLDKRYAPEPPPAEESTPGMPVKVKSVGDFKLEAFREFGLQPQQLKAKDVLGEDWEKKAKVADLPALWVKAAAHRAMPLSS